MPYYIIDTIPTKKKIYLLHETECPVAPKQNRSVEIGYYTDCYSALRYIRVKNPISKFSGCKYCCRSCHNKNI
ncbi:hypothetical protein IGJ53_002420 [Enterococcus sp. DIV1283b]|nr:hypothetical protein [Enterococcus faecium]